MSPVSGPVSLQPQGSPPKDAGTGSWRVPKTMPKARMHSSPCLCGCIRGKLGPEEDQFLTQASLVVHQASGLNFPTCKARWVSACFRMAPFCAPASSGPTPGCPLPSQVPQPLRASSYLHQCFSARLCSIHSQNRRAGRARSPC